MAARSANSVTSPAQPWCTDKLWILDVATIVRFTFNRCSIVKGDLFNIEHAFYVIFKADEMNDFYKYMKPKK